MDASPTNGIPTVPPPADALGRVGREIVERVDLDAITARLGSLPTGPLLAELDAIVVALASTDAREARRRAGVIGRLLARDLVARAHPDPVDNRVRVHLAFAAEHAGALERHLGGLQVMAEHLVQQTAALEQILERGRAAAGPAPDDATRAPDPAQRRLAHLEAIAMSWRGTRAHIAMALDFGRSVLDRYAQVRDVLVPLWRQNAGAAALGTRLHGEDATRLAALRDALRGQIDSLRGDAARTRPTPAPADTEPLP